MWNLLKLMLPLTLSVADDGGGGAGGGAGGAGDADAPTPVGEDHFAEMLQQQELRAGLPGESDADADTDDAGEGAGEGDTDGGTDTAKDLGKAKEGAKEGDKQEYIPKARFDEVLGELKDLKATIAELKKGTQTTQTTQQEPAWKAQLKPLPLREGYMKDGKLTEWESTEAYLDARQDAMNHNARVEADAKAAETKATADAKAQEEKHAADAAAWRKNHVEKTIPEFVKAEGITAEQYQEALAKAPQIPILDAATGDSIGMAIQQLSKDAARFSYAISTSPVDTLLPYAAEIMAAAPGPARTAKIIEVVGRMDALLTHGLGLDGKPRAAGGSAGGGAKGLTTGGDSGRSQSQRASRTTTVVTSTEGGGGAGGEATATGEAHFNAMRAKQQRQTQAKLAGLKR